MATVSVRAPKIGLRAPKLLLPQAMLLATV
jgi:hypothetical protein